MNSAAFLIKIAVNMLVPPAGPVGKTVPMPILSQPPTAQRNVLGMNAKAPRDFKSDLAQLRQLTAMRPKAVTEGGIDPAGLNPMLGDWTPSRLQAANSRFMTGR